MFPNENLAVGKNVTDRNAKFKNGSYKHICSHSKLYCTKKKCPFTSDYATLYVALVSDILPNHFNACPKIRLPTPAATEWYT